MNRIIVRKSPPLSGAVSCSGSKNAVLPILASTVLIPGTSHLTNIPKLSDVDNMIDILKILGAKTVRAEKEIGVDFSECCRFCAPYELVSKLRGSFLLAGPLLARTGRARIPLPGGCPIGSRPIDLHLKGFSALGAETESGHGFVDLSCKKLKGAKIYLDFPSVGATENLIMAAVTADGETTIENAAAEPEICDLADFLNDCGGKITGIGSDTIKIEGVSALYPTSHKIISDRIEAGTYMSAFAITGGCGEIINVNPMHLKPVTAKLTEMGAVITEHENSLSIDAKLPLSSANIKTLPFPGFPTDMQAQFSALMCQTAGTGMIIETVFENRFLHTGELNRMGANIRIDGRSSVIEGEKKLSGSKVTAFDLRGGAALVLAGLCASGETEIIGAEHIERGYENLCGKISVLGGKIFSE